MTCASASRSYGDVNGSPQGFFVLVGEFPVGGNGLLACLLASLICYVVWRWWECFTFQGADATFSPAKNFFRYRLTPFVSGAVYIAYGVYVIEVIAQRKRTECYPECWRDTEIGKAGLALFGIAFLIACITQLINVASKKWHSEINWARCQSKYEEWTVLALGHIGFLGRAIMFLFVSVLMFRAFREHVENGGDAMANGLNQWVDTTAGRFFMYVSGILTCVYGVFAMACGARYRFFPTPPPSGIPLFQRLEDGSVGRNSAAAMESGSREIIGHPSP